MVGYNNHNVSKMSPKSRDEIHPIDIKFLKAVREIEDNPGSFSGTGVTEVPANTSVIREYLGMKADKIRYRMRPAPEGRGFEEMGYVELHDPELTTEGHLGPRSINLTEEGRMMIVDWEKRHGQIDIEDLDATTLEGLEVEIDRVKGRLDEIDGQLQQAELKQPAGAETREEVQQLRSRVDALTEKVKEFQEAEFGAVSEVRSRDLAGTIKMVEGFGFLFDILGVSVAANPHEVDYEDEAAKEQIRNEVRETLGITVNEGDADDSSQAGVDSADPSNDDGEVDPFS